MRAVLFMCLACWACGAGTPEHVALLYRADDSAAQLEDRLLGPYRARHPGLPVALAAFGMGPQETVSLFSSYDEDYHISRFFHFTETGGTLYSINFVPATHVSIDAEIQTIL